jgi:hypothetical protein
MFFIENDYINNKLNNSNFEFIPYKHIIVDNIFTNDFYQKLLENKIPTECLTALVESGSVGKYYSDKRFILKLSSKLTILSKKHRLFWEEIYQWFNTDFKYLIQKKFDFEKEIDLRLLYSRDFQGYELGPHTDNPSKLFTLLIYLTETNDNYEYGTSIFTPKSDYIKNCEGLKHHNFDNFNIFRNIEYKYNRLFGFLKSDNSFHGVLPIKKDFERDILIFDFHEK